MVTSESAAVFNFQVVERNFADMHGAINVGAFVRCEEVFQQVVGARLQALSEAIEAHRVKDVEMLAHQLKGSFLVLGSEALANVCMTLELEAETLEQEKMREHFGFLKERLPLFQEQLKRAVRRVQSLTVEGEG